MLRKKELAGIFGNNPILTETHRARNDYVIAIKDTAHAEWVVSFVFGTRGYPIVVGAEAILPAALCFR